MIICGVLPNKKLVIKLVFDINKWSVDPAPHAPIPLMCSFQWKTCPQVL